MESFTALPNNVVKRLLDEGRLLVHDGPPGSHAAPDSDNFHSWMLHPTIAGLSIPTGFSQCGCGWRADLGRHYVPAERIWRDSNRTTVEDLIGPDT